MLRTDIKQRNAVMGVGLGKRVQQYPAVAHSDVTVAVAYYDTALISGERKVADHNVAGIAHQHDRLGDRIGGQHNITGLP